MKGVFTLLLLGIALRMVSGRLFALQNVKKASKTPQPRKAFLTWDRDEWVNRQNDRQQCILISPRELGPSDAREASKSKQQDNLTKAGI